MPIGPRPKDPVIPDRVDWAGAQKDGKAIEPGVFYCQDVYQDSPEILRGKARYLRVIPWLEEDGIEGASPMERQAANDLSKIPLEHPGATGACTGAGSSTRAADTGTSASFPLRDC